MSVSAKDILMLRKAGAKFGPQAEFEPVADEKPEGPSAIEQLLSELVETQKKILALGATKIPAQAAPQVDVNVEASPAPHVTVAAPSVSVSTPAAPRAWDVEVTERDKNGRMKAIRITAA